MSPSSMVLSNLSHLIPTSVMYINSFFFNHAQNATTILQQEKYIYKVCHVIQSILEKWGSHGSSLLANFQPWPMSFNEEKELRRTEFQLCLSQGFFCVRESTAAPLRLLSIYFLLSQQCSAEELEPRTWMRMCNRVLNSTTLLALVVSHGCGFHN